MAQQEHLFDPQGLAAYLGLPIGTLYRWRASRPRRGPKALKVGRHLRYRKCDVDLWLAELADDPVEPPPPPRRKNAKGKAA